MDTRLTISKAIVESTTILRPVSLTPRRDAEHLLAHLLDAGRAHLIAHPERRLTAEQTDVFRAHIARRAEEWPIAYLTGKQGFYGLELKVTPDVLIPRPETEHLVGAAIGWANQQTNVPLSVIDVGTGSGAIAVTLAVHLQHAHITAIDSSPPALALAQHNASIYNVQNRINFVEGDLLAPVAQPADIIAANLPYVPTNQLNRIPNIEPRAALDGGPDGLEIIHRLLRQAPALMKEKSLLLMEIGAFNQAQTASRATRKAFASARVSLLHDYANRPRVIQVELI